MSFAVCSPILVGMANRDAAPPHRRVYMFFMHRSGWYCQFLESDLKTPLPRKFNFASADKVRELAERGGALNNLENRHALNHGIDNGRGGVWLMLTAEQYAKLKRAR
jgi:hypothetical protein